MGGGAPRRGNGSLTPALSRSDAGEGVLPNSGVSPRQGLCGEINLFCGISVRGLMFQDRALRAQALLQ